MGRFVPYWLVLLPLAACHVDVSCNGLTRYVDGEAVEGIVRKVAEQIGTIDAVECPQIRAEVGATDRCTVAFELGDRPYGFVVKVEPPASGTADRFTVTATMEVRLVGPGIQTLLDDGVHEQLGAGATITCPGLDRVRPAPASGFVTCTVRAADGTETARRLDFTDKDTIATLIAAP